MEKKKNIICIMGRDRVGVRIELDRFTKAFRERQSDTNIEIISIDENIDFRNLEQMTQAVGLFAEKRLFILKGTFQVKNERKGKEKKEDTRSESMIKILEHIDDETFIILIIEGDIPGSLGSWLNDHADVRIFDQVFSREAWGKRYTSLSPEIISTVLEKYERLYALYEEDKKPKNMSSLINESLEKISLLQESYTLTPNHISESILLDSSGRVFDLIDAILSVNRKKAIELFHILEGETTMYQFLPSLIGLFRGSVYVRYFKMKGYSESEIQKIMKIHPYTIKKAFTSAISWESIREFYDEIVSINIAYRSGKGLHDPELGRIFGIERAIMSLKK